MAYHPRAIQKPAQGPTAWRGGILWAPQSTCAARTKVSCLPKDPAPGPSLGFVSGARVHLCSWALALPACAVPGGSFPGVLLSQCGSSIQYHRFSKIVDAEIA